MDCPSAFLSNKEALLLKQRALFQEKFDPLLPFKLNNFLILHSLKYSYIFRISVMRLLGHNDVYAIKMIAIIGFGIVINAFGFSIVQFHIRGLFILSKNAS